MSSSMFMESSSQPALNQNEYANTSDANLVVVYGKSGVSFDDKGLESLVEEKKISSISVIRLTSPTPSMQDEEDEAEKLEELLRRQEIGSPEDSLCTDTDDFSSSCGKHDAVGYEGSSNDDDNIEEKKFNKESDSELNETKIKQRKQLRRRGRQPNAIKQKKLQHRRIKDRPEIVGLRLEEFYPPEDANEIIKEALKMAGLETDKKTQSDYDFQLFVIQNDHCYTPFTSPTQMKTKLAADKLEAEKQAINRKNNIMQPTIGKQLFVRKKQIQISQNLDQSQIKQSISSSTLKDEAILVGSKTKKDIKDRKVISIEDYVDNEHIHSSHEDNDNEIGDEDETDLSGADDSADTDNDRDSDLDFDVNNPKGRKRKTKVLKTVRRPLVVSKLISKPKRFYSHDETKDISNTIVASQNAIHKQKTCIKNSFDISRITVRSTPSKTLHAAGLTSALSPAVAALPPIPKKSDKPPLNANGSSNSSSLSPKTYIVFKSSLEQKSSTLQHSQTHKEIVINKVMISPKTRGFTDLTTLIDQNDETTKPAMSHSTKITSIPMISKPSINSSITSAITLSIAPSAIKRFTPLETSTKSQLPTQISIQTHQSSSELEAEHDKQLDLINSIVQDEMKKSNEKPDEKITNLNENIPELVKMLESTEKVLVSGNLKQDKAIETVHNVKDLVSDNNVNNKCISDNNPSILNQTVTPSNDIVGGIDITSATLLATTEEDNSGDLPEDILQQVVELIKDDKTLQEAVEKQVFGTSISNEQGISGNVIDNQNPPPLVPISKQSLKIHEKSPSTTKSIIEMSISNVSTSLGSSSSVTAIADSASKITSGTTTSIPSNQTSKSTPVLRKEPIQIIRGNGRVITLPPIEAPTTRAKRRAQVQPISSLSTVVNTSFNSSAISNESSDALLHCTASTTLLSNNAVIPQEKKVQDSSGRRRVSKENVSGANQKSATTTNRKTSTAKKTGNKSNVTKSQIEAEASDSEEDDDDDPNKLWCICRQPHNNRFMICCDVCEDWFHGTCVSITKAMGLEMEQKGIDWTCPKCLKKQEDKKQPKITEMLIKKPTTTNVAQLISSPISNDPLANISPVVTTSSSTLSLAENNTSICNKSGETENKRIPSENESTTNIESTSQIKLQCGQIINLKDYNTSNTKRATIIQTSANSTSCITAGQKKIFVTSGQASLKLSSQPGTPIRTITVVKQLTTLPQNQQQHNIKILNTISPITTTTTYNATTTTTDIVSNCSTITTTASAQILTKNTTLCIVCKKFARFNSIYCSDDCIRKHAQNALNSLMAKSQADNYSQTSVINKGPTEDKIKKRPKGLFEELLSAADRKPKVERVNVYERKSGRIITGNNAPTTANLKKWLQDNPTFEVIQPGSVQALDLEKKQKIRSQHSLPNIIKSASSPPPLKMFSSAGNNTLPKIESHTVSSQTLHTKTNKAVVEQVKNSSMSIISRPSTPKQLQKYPQHVGIKPDKITKSVDESKASNKEKSLGTKRQTSTENSNKSSNADGEPIRLVVRRTLKEQLLLRIKEEETSNSSNESDVMDCESTKISSNVPKLSEEEVDEFVKATELEMYNFFSRDTGSKYKAKYRSLIFNIKDRKNHTLFAKICGKLIEPKQLVRMSPEEMASQELAQWREQEAKHQLEMIKKSELDLLSCAKNYVLKTHKGEEVIEGKSSDYANVDITIPVEDVVSALNKSDLPDNTKTTSVRKESQVYISDVDSALMSNSYLPAESHLVNDPDRMKISSPIIKDKDREKDKEKESSRNRDRGRDRDKRHKSKDRHHDKLKSRKRSRSRSVSRSRDKGEKRHKNSYKEEKRDRSKDTERVKEYNEGNERKTEIKKSVATHSKQITKKHIEQQKTSNIPLNTYNLIDKILESRKTVEEAANIVSEKDKEKENENNHQKTSTALMPIQSATSTVSTCSSSNETAIVVDIPATISSVESDQEPTSTVSIPTPPHDPYARFMTCVSPLGFDSNVQDSINSLWTGNINMVDVTSFNLTIQAIVGNSTNLAKLLPRELDVVGRIGPDTVWDYISKIKKSPNKEIVVIRLIPANESETAAYKILYEYLDNRNRLGVIKSTSPQIKDFYIYPLGAGKNVPSHLEPTEPVEFYDDQYRPDVLIGIIIRVVGNKRSIPLQATPGASSISSGVNKHQNRANDVDTFTPPGSPKTKKLRQSIPTKKVDDIDIDAIIKAPIVAKVQKSTIPPPLSKLNDDADEPYSPGGSSDDDLPLLPIKVASCAEHMQVAEDDLKRKMEEINRQIAAQEMEIAGLLTGEPSTFGSTAASTSNVLANISIPSNLSQILASIKTTGKDGQSIVPPPPPLIGSLLKPPTSSSPSAKEYNPIDIMGSKSTNKGSNINTTTSLLAKLSEEELLSMVPDDIAIAPKNSTRYEEPPPPGV